MSKEIGSFPQCERDKIKKIEKGRFSKIVLF
jgi:hypothetical protein